MPLRQRDLKTTLREVARDYVLSCGCTRRKRAQSHGVDRVPARFKFPWEVLEMDLLDVKHESKDDKKLMLMLWIGLPSSPLLFPHPLRYRNRSCQTLHGFEFILEYRERSVVMREGSTPQTS